MGLFDRSPVVPPAPPEPKYTIDKIQERLDAFGFKRLSVRDPQLKVLISKVTWSALPHLDRISGGKPNGGHIAEMISKLDMLNATIDQYVKIQNNPGDYSSQGDIGALMASGFRAVESYFAEMSKGNSSQDLFNYQATADFLSGHVTSI